MGRLQDKVAVVTGASRGAGRGIARVLGEEGATVYVTGRTTRQGPNPTGRPGTIEDAAQEVTDRGGTGIPVRVDHTDDAQVRALFDRVAAERGRLDLLVSNAWGGYERMVDVTPAWELDPAHLDLMLQAGLRAHLLTVQRAAPLLAATRDGLVVLTTWAVDLHRQYGNGYHGNLYYDVVKTAINRIPVGLAEELAPSGVTVLAVSPGWMHTEVMGLPPELAEQTESTEFVGRAVAALAADPKVRRHTGTLKTVVELAAEYGFTDVDGRPTSGFWEDFRASPIKRLRDAMDGQVIEPGDPGYEEARRVFYRHHDRRPAAVVRPADAAGVAQVVALARDSGLELAVRSGGHSLAGHSTTDGGIVLDLGGMKAMEVDPQGRTAWAQAGLTAGEYTNAAAAHGLATGFGDTASVGIGGITLGGGVGYLVRKHGLTIDDLLAAELVTADGQVLQVDDEQHPDLFWAIRGGGGNFGVATRFRYRLHPVSQVVGGMLLLPATPETIEAFVAEAEAAPEELSTIANVMVAPPMEFVPAEHHGELVLMALLAYAGEVEAGERAVARLRAVATPIVDMVRPMPYPELYKLTEGPGPDEEAARSLFIDAVDRRVAETVVDRLRASTAPLAVAQLRVLGGAMARVPVEATAFAHRHRRVMVAVGAVYEHADDAAEHEAWVTGFADALRQGDAGVYVNFLGDEGEARVRAAYPGATFERLAAVKARYDPTNLFRHNQNVPPSTGTG
jgi:FAD/FMN-containing dehydrogenase/NAD(P)-dependent dehydrogenase (short-subunit alcohol dehydrogenase family)